MQWEQLTSTTPGVNEYQLVLTSANVPGKPYYDGSWNQITLQPDPVLNSVGTQVTPGVACYTGAGPCVSYDPSGFKGYEFVFSKPVYAFDIHATGNYWIDATMNGHTVAQSIDGEAVGPFTSIEIFGAPQGEMLGASFTYSAPEPSTFALMLLAFAIAGILRGRKSFSRV